MAVDTPAKIAVLGAGPIGIEAALYARFLGYDVVIFEKGEVCDYVRSWGHVQMFTPFGENRSSLGLAAIQAQDETYKPPPDDAMLSGREWVEQYLIPLSQTDLLAEHLRLRTQVLSVGKEEIRKQDLPGDEERGDWPFRILVRDALGKEYFELADVVIDATGVFGQANWMGHGGIPACGEIGLRELLEYRLPDFMGADQQRYAGKHTLLIGQNWMAATNALALDALARQSPNTRVTWVIHNAQQGDGEEDSPVPAEQPIAAHAPTVNAAITLISEPEGRVEIWPQTLVESIHSRTESTGFRVTLSGKREGEFEFDSVIANVGFRPDSALHAELQVNQCWYTDRPLCMDSENDSKPGGMRSPEPNFYILGAKRAGRDVAFLFSQGLQQIRRMYAIVGDRQSLDLYASTKTLLR
jgi:thioredoxin reductase